MGKKKPPRRVEITREVIEGDIKKITKHRKIIEPSDGLPSEERDGEVADAGGEHRTDDEEPLGSPETLFPNACSASYKNGFSYVVHPCITVKKHAIYFNEPACEVFGLRHRMLFHVSMTDNGKEIRLRNVVGTFRSTVEANRLGLFSLRVEKMEPGECRVKRGVLTSKGRLPLSLTAHRPGLVDHVFRLHQHSRDSALLIAPVGKGYVPATQSLAERLMMRDSRSALSAHFADVIPERN